MRYPVYQEALPSMFGKELKAIRVHKNTFEKLNKIKDKKQDENLLGIPMQNSTQRESPRLGFIALNFNDMVSQRKKEEIQYKTIEDYFEEVKHKVEPVVQKRQEFWTRAQSTS